MLTSTGRKLLGVAAVAIGAAALSTMTSTPANAAPCTAWKLDAGALVINQDNGIVVSVDWPANTNKPTRGSFTSGGTEYGGGATGGIVGGNRLDFTVNFQGQPENGAPVTKVSNH